MKRRKAAEMRRGPQPACSEAAAGRHSTHHSRIISKRIATTKSDLTPLVLGLLYSLTQRQHRVTLDWSVHTTELNHRRRAEKKDSNGREKRESSNRRRRERDRMHAVDVAAAGGAARRAVVRCSAARGRHRASSRERDESSSCTLDPRWPRGQQGASGSMDGDGRSDAALPA